jgi:hypothetical protein
MISLVQVCQNKVSVQVNFGTCDIENCVRRESIFWLWPEGQSRSRFNAVSCLLETGSHGLQAMGKSASDRPTAHHMWATGCFPPTQLQTRMSKYT